MTKWKPVVIESPFKGNDQHSEATHREYLNRAIKDCIEHGETPYASHKMLTDSLDDGYKEERQEGMEAGLSMATHLVERGARVTFYVDYGMSGGMTSAQGMYEALHIAYTERSIGKNPEPVEVDARGFSDAVALALKQAGV